MKWYWFGIWAYGNSSILWIVVWSEDLLSPNVLPSPHAYISHVFNNKYVLQDEHKISIINSCENGKRIFKMNFNLF
jgi:hypothetical protein